MIGATPNLESLALCDTIQEYSRMMFKELGTCLKSWPSTIFHNFSCQQPATCVTCKSKQTYPEGLRIAPQVHCAKFSWSCTRSSQGEETNPLPKELKEIPPASIPHNWSQWLPVYFSTISGWLLIWTPIWQQLIFNGEPDGSITDSCRRPMAVQLSSFSETTKPLLTSYGSVGPWLTAKSLANGFDVHVEVFFTHPHVDETMVPICCTTPLKQQFLQAKLL